MRLPRDEDSSEDDFEDAEGDDDEAASVKESPFPMIAIRPLDYDPEEVYREWREWYDGEDHAESEGEGESEEDSTGQFFTSGPDC